MRRPPPAACASSSSKRAAGESPPPGSRVSVHYTGMLEDGTVFDSSYKRGQPFEFDLGEGRVIAGWDEGIALMKAGGRNTG